MHRLGRKPIAGVALGGIILGLLVQMVVVRFNNIFPIRLVWLASASPLLGGGLAVLSAVVMSVATDVTSEDQR
jgi:hypothetical protein